jgi:glycosyltransferase involved in cell wall biosynthesis
MNHSKEELAADLGSLITELRSVAPSAPLDGPRFTIVMPAYNSADFIERSILSVLNQDWNNIELIVIDGGSSDGTVEIIQRYADRIAYWETAADQGQSDALNKGFAKASGEIYGWLNADDLYMPNALRRAAAALATPGKNMVYGDWLTIDSDDAVTFRHTALPPSLPRLIADGFQFNMQSLFWRPALHDKAGPFDIRLHRTMDYDFAAGLLAAASPSEIVVIENPLGCFRRHASQKTQGFDPKVEAEQRLIAQTRGFSWKYTWRAKPVRLYSKLVKALVWARRGAFHEFNRSLTADRSTPKRA